MEEQTQISESFEIPSRWRRLSAYLLDIIISLAIILISLPFWILGPGIIFIWIIINLVVILRGKTTLWNDIVWIKAINENNNPVNIKQSLLRHLIFSPILLNITVCIWFSVSLLFRLVPESCSFEHPSDFCQMERTVWEITNFICMILLIPCFINIFEIFFKCPTFIDKRLSIKRIYKKSK